VEPRPARDLGAATGGRAVSTALPPALVLMTTYQQAPFVRAAVRSVLPFAYAPLEILISDDASTDGTFEILQAEVDAYRGPHPVRLIRQATRQNHRHTRGLLPRIRQEHVVFAHGDDLQRPDRVARLVDALVRTGAAIVTSDAMMIDDEDRELGLLEGSGRSRAVTAVEIARRGWQPTLLGASFAMRRSPQLRLDRDLEAPPPNFDLIRCFRAALLDGGAHFLGEPLLRYRRHRRNAGNYIADFTSSAAIFRETIGALELSNFAWMLGDLEAAAALYGRNPQHDAVEAALQEAVLSHADAMAARRLALMREGLAHAWLSPADAAARTVRGEHMIKGKPAAAEATR